MFKKIDDFLNSITMYRLTLYYLIFLLAAALIYSIFGVLPFGPLALVFSVAILVAVSYAASKVFEKIFKVQTNFESLYITALILALIITPAKTPGDILFLFLAAILSQASKYVLNIRGKHIFNPAGIAVFVTAFLIHGYASWWVGTLAMVPFVLSGVLIVRKIRRFDLVFYFFVANIITTILLRRSILPIFTDSPILFFAFVMLTEPLTTPPTNLLQSIYGGIVGVLAVPFHIGAFFTTPEIALVVGNIFSYLVSPKDKLVLKLKDKLKLTNNIYDFVFDVPKKIQFRPGQYLEWTLGQAHTDSRGNRRYMTIASSPTENNIRIGMKFPEGQASSFKRTMLAFKNGDKIVASELAGDFTLPKDKLKKLVFVAGGIGVTPYRSIIKYLIDTNEKRDIVLLYFEKAQEEFVYKDIFNEAEDKLGIKVIYVETEKQGHADIDMILRMIPDFKERLFYISGSQGIVDALRGILAKMKLPERQIKVDYFPGY